MTFLGMHKRNMTVVYGNKEVDRLSKEGRNQEQQDHPVSYPAAKIIFKTCFIGKQDSTLKEKEMIYRSATQKPANYHLNLTLPTS